MQHIYDKLVELLGENVLLTMLLTILVGNYVNAVASLGKILFKAPRGWDSAASRLKADADKLGGPALSKAHHINGSITISMPIGALVHTGHPPGIHIGPVAEIGID